MTKSDNMPVRIDNEDDPDEDFPIRPDTNEETVLRYLTIHSEYAFRPMELADETPVSDSSINKTLARLQDKGLVTKFNSMYSVNQDQREYIAKQLDRIHSLDILSGASEAPVTDTRDETSTESGTSDDVATVFDEMGIDVDNQSD